LIFSLEKQLSKFIQGTPTVTSCKKHGLGDELKRLLKAYMTDGKNVDDNDTLIVLGEAEV
jgi:predicted DsbA family dithiol-disulfide isomerase